FAFFGLAGGTKASMVILTTVSSGQQPLSRSAYTPYSLLRKWPAKSNQIVVSFLLLKELALMQFRPRHLGSLCALFHHQIALPTLRGFFHRACMSPPDNPLIDAARGNDPAQGTVFLLRFIKSNDQCVC
ncbi:MAG: hypothetical protein RR811_15755, partial [Comamonas sp.]